MWAETSGWAPIGTTPVSPTAPLIPQNWPFPSGLRRSSVNRKHMEFEVRMFGSSGRLELVTSWLTRITSHVPASLASHLLFNARILSGNFRWNYRCVSALVRCG